MNIAKLNCFPSDRHFFTLYDGCRSLSKCGEEPHSSDFYIESFVNYKISEILSKRLTNAAAQFFSSDPCCISINIEISIVIVYKQSLKLDVEVLKASWGEGVKRLPRSVYPSRECISNISTHVHEFFSRPCSI